MQRAQLPSASSVVSSYWGRAVHPFLNVLLHNGVAEGTAEPSAPTQPLGLSWVGHTVRGSVGS